jgi:hypothetical protein
MTRFLLSTRRLAMVATALLLLFVALASLRSANVNAEAPAHEAFDRTWQRTDEPVLTGAVNRTWMWGQEAFTGPLQEDYAESPGGERLVQYFDKARMEITKPDAVDDGLWYVSNGLLVVELVTGRMQMGDASFVDLTPAQIPVAGDPTDTTGPTYATFAGLLNAPAYGDGELITLRVNRAGEITPDAALGSYGVTAAHHVVLEGLDHQVASPFWEFMNAVGPVLEDGQLVTEPLFENAYYATGYPVTEAYWTTVDLDDVPTNVLLQCFERRCLTYTPDNPDGWKVEAGNVGLHYHHWRYVQIPTETTPTPTATSTAPTETPTATESPSVEPTATLPDGVTTTGDMEIEGITSAGVIMRNMQIAGDIQMAGWQLRTDDGLVFTFPEVVVREGFYVTVQNCPGNNIIENKYAILYWGSCVDGYYGKRFSLYDSTGTLVDQHPD